MAVRIDRVQKNLMRTRLEDVLAVHKDLEERIDTYLNDTEHEEYRQFWEQLAGGNRENIRVVSGFMVRKCNR